MKLSNPNILTALILAGLILGVLMGQFVLFDPAVSLGSDHWTRVAGDIVLIRPLMMLIVPLIFVSVLFQRFGLARPVGLWPLGLMLRYRRL